MLGCIGKRVRPYTPVKSISEAAVPHGIPLNITTSILGYYISLSQAVVVIFLRGHFCLYHGGRVINWSSFCSYATIESSFVDM